MPSGINEHGNEYTINSDGTIVYKNWDGKNAKKYKPSQ